MSFSKLRKLLVPSLFDEPWPLVKSRASLLCVLLLLEPMLTVTGVLVLVPTVGFDVEVEPEVAAAEDEDESNMMILQSDKETSYRPGCP
jgi:hypothetical protein